MSITKFSTLKKIFWNYVAAQDVNKEIYGEVPCALSPASSTNTSTVSSDYIFEIKRKHYIKISYENSSKCFIYRIIVFKFENLSTKILIVFS